jgi:hypothetical protein
VPEFISVFICPQVLFVFFLLWASKTSFLSFVIDAFILIFLCFSVVFVFVLVICNFCALLSPLLFLSLNSSKPNYFGCWISSVPVGILLLWTLPWKCSYSRYRTFLFFLIAVAQNWVPMGAPPRIEPHDLPVPCARHADSNCSYATPGRRISTRYLSTPHPQTVANSRTLLSCVTPNAKVKKSL